MLGKKSNLSYDDIRERYEHFRSRCINSSESNKDTQIIEQGCTEPLYGVKSKCILNIVPKDKNTESLYIDNKCILKRISDDLNEKEEISQNGGFYHIGRSRKLINTSKKKRSKNTSKKKSKRRSKK